MAAAALPPPALTAPAPREVSFGRIAGLASPGVHRVVVRVGSRVLADERIRGRSFDFSVSLPRGEVVVRVTAGRTFVVPHVFGLPRSARPRGVLGRFDPTLERRLRALERGFPGTSAGYVLDLQTGEGAAWNARARFPAASTLKLAIAVEVLRALRHKPSAGSYVDRQLSAMLEASSNEAANALEAFFGGGRRVDELLRSLGLVDSEMFGGYLRSEDTRRPIPLSAESQPDFGRGKYTTAFDLARLLHLVHLAAGGKGLLAERYRGAFTSSDARYLLYLLAHVTDRGKLDRYVAGGPVMVLHKAGWISSARHDAGLVYWPGGVFVATVMTYGAGVGEGSDVLAGRVARTALDVLRQHVRARPKPGTR